MCGISSPYRPRAQRFSTQTEGQKLAIILRSIDERPNLMEVLSTRCPLHCKADQHLSSVQGNIKPNAESPTRRPSQCKTDQHPSRIVRQHKTEAIFHASHRLFTPTSIKCTVQGIMHSPVKHQPTHPEAHLGTVLVVRGGVVLGGRTQKGGRTFNAGGVGTMVDKVCWAVVLHRSITGACLFV